LSIGILLLFLWAICGYLGGAGDNLIDFFVYCLPIINLLIIQVSVILGIGFDILLLNK
jgi:hypothetical protein